MQTVADSGFPGITSGLPGAGRFVMTSKVSVSSFSLSFTMGIVMHCISPAALPKVTEVLTAM